jgi:hypothetical protein
VRAVQYVFRRGAVYWWRRRLLKKTGERELAPIALSLGTRELSKARAIGAYLAVASDGILRRRSREVLSQIQVRSILESVARTHLAKMDRLAVMETADGVSADEGRSSDRVVGWARRLQAVQGASATVHDAERRMLAENGLTQSEIEEVGQVLDLPRRASAPCAGPEGRGGRRPIWCAGFPRISSRVVKQRAETVSAELKKRVIIREGDAHGQALSTNDFEEEAATFE